MLEDDEGQPNETAIRIATTVAALAAAFVVQRAVAAGWRAVTGHHAPRADDDDFSLGEIITYTAISAATVAAVRVFTARQAHHLVRRVTA
jgi:hypothetical protein